MGTVRKPDRVIVPLLFLFSAVVWRSSYYILSLYVAIPLFIIYCFRYYFSDIRGCKQWGAYVFLIVWMFLSCLVSDESEPALRRMIPITASFLLAFSSYSITKNSKYSGIMYFSYIALLGYLLYVNISRGEFVGSFDYSNELERKNNMKLNANDYAYYMLFATMSLKMLTDVLGDKLRAIWKLFFYVLFMALSFYVALLTASRQVLTLQIPLFLFIIFYDFLWTKKSGNAIILFVIITAIIVALPIIVDLYSDSYLATRSQVTYQEDIRSQLLQRAVDQGFTEPIFGVGLGADTFFSHCTYTHLFARTGFPALVAFLIITVSSVLSQLSRYVRTKNHSFFLYFVLLSFIAVGHFLYSYIDEPFMMSIAFLIIGQSDRNYKLIRKHV